ncbi:MAG: SpoIIE family protein phosphatase [Pyrinomonadaceae bacterium]|nr:SpoIIE family protein phosphatase [Pyrinomonadaceae bacterium]
MGDESLALYTDGVTESFNEVGKEFGEQRLIEALRRRRALSSSVSWWLNSSS